MNAETQAREYLAAQKVKNKPIDLLYIQELTGLNHAAANRFIQAYACIAFRASQTKQAARSQEFALPRSLRIEDETRLLLLADSL